MSTLRRLFILAGLYATLGTIASADVLTAKAFNISFPDCLPTTVDTGATLTQSLICTGTSNGKSVSMDETASAAYGDLGISISGDVANGSAEAAFAESVSFNGTATVICPSAPGNLQCIPGSTIMTYPPMSTFQASFIFALNASFTITNTFQLLAVTDVSVDANTILTHEDCNEIESPCDDVSTDGSFADIFATPFQFTSDQQISLQVDFSLNFNCDGLPCDADFGDPVLSEIVITDPLTGLPISGITAIGNAGNVIPINTNAASAPEPSTFVLLASALLSAICGARKTTELRPTNARRTANR